MGFTDRFAGQERCGGGWKKKRKHNTKLLQHQINERKVKQTQIRLVASWCNFQGSHFSGQFCSLQVRISLVRQEAKKKIKYLLPAQFFQVSYHLSRILIKFYKIPLYFQVWEPWRFMLRCYTKCFVSRKVCRTFADKMFFFMHQAQTHFLRVG